MISIITVTFNAEKSIATTIDSIKTQTSKNFEWIVVDGNSNDRTIEILQKNPTIIKRMLSEPDSGVYDAINKAIKLITFDYYIILGAGDALNPDAVDRLNKYLDSNYYHNEMVSFPILFGDKVKRGKPWAKYLKFLGHSKVISSHSVGLLIKKSLHNKVGIYSTELKILSDELFVLKALDSGVKIGYPPGGPIGKFDLNGISSTHHERSAQEHFSIQKSRGLPNSINLVVYLLRILRYKYIHRR